MARAESVRSLFAYLPPRRRRTTPWPTPPPASRRPASRRLDEAEPWDDVSGGRYVVRGGALVAWRVARRRAADAPGSGSWAPTPTRPTCGSSPTPTPAASGWRQLAVEVYGGALVNSWLDRDLGPVRPGGAGATARSCSSCVDRPLARVPQLAIHLDRDVNERGLVLDKQVHLTPVWGLGPPAEGDFVALRGRRAGRARPGRHRRLGPDAARPHAAALLGVEQRAHRRPPASTTCARPGRRSTALAEQRRRARADRRGLPVRPRGGGLGEHHRRRRAAPGDVLDRLVLARGGAAERPPPRARRVVVRLGRHGPRRPPQLPRAPRAGPPPAARTRGPVLKVNANQRYATDATTAALFTRACRAGRRAVAGVRVPQLMPCGSTIGPITAARLGHRHGRRRLRPAVDALGPGAVRRRRPRLPGRRARRLLRRGVTARAGACSRSAAGAQRRVAGLTAEPSRRPVRASAASKRRCSSSWSVRRDLGQGRPRHPALVGARAPRSAARRSRWTLRRVDELAIPWAWPARTRRCRRARSARRPWRPRRRRRRRGAGRAGRSCARPPGTARAARRPCSTAMQRTSASLSALPRVTGNPPSADRNQPGNGLLPQRVLAHVAQPPAGDDRTRSGVSMFERCTGASTKGPERGTCSRPSTVMRNHTRQKPTQTARASW